MRALDARVGLGRDVIGYRVPVAVAVGGQTQDVDSSSKKSVPGFTGFRLRVARCIRCTTSNAFVEPLSPERFSFLINFYQVDLSSFTGVCSA